jgi:hypothetical protein
MKKLLYSILALAGVVATSCTQEHIDVTYDPTKVDAPVINSVTAGVLADEEPVTINYTDVNFNHQVSLPVYTLYVAKAGQEMKDQVAISGIEFDKAEAGADGSKSISIAAKTVNNLLVKTFAAEYDVEFSLDFQIVAAVKNEKGTAVAGTESYSNIVSVKVTPFEVKEAQPDKDLFQYMYVVGSHNGWDHAAVAKNYDFIYDYEGNGVYRGVVNMRKPEANTEFKLTTGDWGKDEHSMAEGEFADEAASIDLVAGGGANINVYKKNQYYVFEFDKTNLKFSKVYAFDTLGVIGLNGNWDTDAVKMEYNALYTRFFADIEATADCEIKVRANDGWDINWGADCVSNGNNIKIAAGKYRVYLDLNKNTLVVNENMYGKDEPGIDGGATTPEEPEEPAEPEGPKTEENRWGVVGSFTEWGKQADLYMDEVAENLFVRTGVTLTADDEFKVRYNNDWNESYGAEGEVATVTVGEKFVLTKKDSKNLKVAAGTYDIYIDTKDFNLWVMNANETPEGLGLATYKLYADVTAAGWETCKVYGWGDLGNFAGDWSGSEMTATKVDGKDYFVWQFNVVAKGKTINFLLNNGEGGDNNQTENIEDLKLESDVYVTVLASEDGKAKCKYTLGK